MIPSHKDCTKIQRCPKFSKIFGSIAERPSRNPIVYQIFQNLWFLPMIGPKSDNALSFSEFMVPFHEDHPKIQQCTIFSYMRYLFNYRDIRLANRIRIYRICHRTSDKKNFPSFTIRLYFFGSRAKIHPNSCQKFSFPILRPLDAKRTNIRLIIRIKKTIKSTTVGKIIANICGATFTDPSFREKNFGFFYTSPLATAFCQNFQKILNYHLR